MERVLPWQRGLSEYDPEVKFEIIVEDSRVDEIVDVIVNVARTGEVGDGKIFISSIDSVVRVRTGEKDEAAV